MIKAISVNINEGAETGGKPVPAPFLRGMQAGCSNLYCRRKRIAKRKTIIYND